MFRHITVTSKVDICTECGTSRSHYLPPVAEGGGREGGGIITSQQGCQVTGSHQWISKRTPRDILSWFCGYF